jgi:hypothetical protein
MSTGGSAQEISFGWGLDDKIALSDDAVIAILERFDPVLIVPTAHRQRSDDLIGAGQGSPGIPFRMYGLAVVEFV